MDSRVYEESNIAIEFTDFGVRTDLKPHSDEFQYILKNGIVPK